MFLGSEVVGKFRVPHHLTGGAVSEVVGNMSLSIIVNLKKKKVLERAGSAASPAPSSTAYWLNFTDSAIL